MVEISAAAAREINRIKASQQKPDSHLRVKITSGGCSGLFYHLSLESNAIELSDNSDRQYHSQGINILVDSQSAQYIQKLKLDYSEDLMGGGFRFQNPKATNICGCGLSFAVRQ
jgi:iron-sulfur cluster assembly protein